MRDLGRNGGQIDRTVGGRYADEQKEAGADLGDSLPASVYRRAIDALSNDTHRLDLFLEPLSVVDEALKRILG